MESLEFSGHHEDREEVFSAASERRAKIFRAVLESELTRRYEEACLNEKALFCTTIDAERGIMILFPDRLEREYMQERCQLVQRRMGIDAPVRLFDDQTGTLLPFASRVIDELRPRLQNGRARREGFGQRRYLSLRTLLISVMLDGLKQGILSIACLYTFCRAADLRTRIWSTGLFSRRGVARDAELIAQLERVFHHKGLNFLAPDGNLSDECLEVLEEVRIQLLCASDAESRRLLRAFDDFEQDEEAAPIIHLMAA